MQTHRPLTNTHPCLVIACMSLISRNRNFRLLFSASAITNLGDGVSALAFPWLATLITRDPVLIAWVAFSTRLPWLLFTIPAGVITDRFNKRSLMVSSDVLRACLTALVVTSILLFDTNSPNISENLFIAVLSVLAFLLGSAEVVRDNAAQTILPSIVDKSELEHANGQLWSVEQVMGQFVGPPLAGFLIAWAVPLPFVLDAITFLAAAWIVWKIPLPKKTGSARSPVLVEAAEGIKWMWHQPVILQLAIMLGILNALHMATLTVLVLFSQEILGLSAAGHGILLTAGAAGGVVGGLLCPRISERVGGKTSLWLALLLMALPFVVIALTANPVVTAAALFVEMFAALLWNVVTVSYRQRIIPGHLLGRVNSIYRFFGWGLMPIGALIGGIIVALAEPEFGRDVALRMVFWVAAFGTFIMLVYALARLRLR